MHPIVTLFVWPDTQRPSCLQEAWSIRVGRLEWRRWKPQPEPYPVELERRLRRIRRLEIVGGACFIALALFCIALAFRVPA